MTEVVVTPAGDFRFGERAEPDFFVLAIDEAKPLISHNPHGLLTASRQPGILLAEGEAMTGR